MRRTYYEQVQEHKIQLHSHILLTYKRFCLFDLCLSRLAILSFRLWRDLDPIVELRG